MLAETVSSVGRIGRLALEFERRGERTILAHSHGTSPWHLLPSMDLDDSGAAYALLLNPSGGLVGGDHVSIDVRLGAGSHAIISSPSANRVYRSTGAVAVQDIELHLGPGSRLEWVPDLTIPFAGSRFQQRLSVQLEPGATILCWDALASGRIARGERWAFSTLTNEISIAGPGGSLVERYRLSGGAQEVGVAAGWDYVGSFYLIGDAVRDAVWKAFDEALDERLDSWPGRVLAGISEPSGRGRVVKALARGASELQLVFGTVWQVARERLWGLPAGDLRRY